MSKSRVIQVLRDPHVVFDSYEDKATLLCEYRTLIELEGGEVVLISATADEMKEGYPAEELWSECGCYRSEVEDVTEDCIINSIEAWRHANRNSTDESPDDTVKWVLRQFVKAGMINIGDELYDNFFLCKHLHKMHYVKSHIMSSSAINYKNCYWESKRCA